MSTISQYFLPNFFPFFIQYLFFLILHYESLPYQLQFIGKSIILHLRSKHIIDPRTIPDTMVQAETKNKILGMTG